MGEIFPTNMIVVGSFVDFSKYQEGFMLSQAP